jgi:hypothetical protein
MRAAHESGVQQAGDREIVDEAPAPAQQRLVLEAVDAGADYLLHGTVIARRPPISGLPEIGNN